MKKYYLIIVTLFFVSFAYTQSNNEEVDLIQAAFGMDKKMIVSAFVSPADAQADDFWALYDEYESERKVLGKERLDLLNLYADQYLTLTAEEADAWTVKVMALQKKTDKLITSYYKKIKKISDGILATQFYQIEAYILTGIRMEVLDEIPFVQE